MQRTHNQSSDAGIDYNVLLSILERTEKYKGFTAKKEVVIQSFQTTPRLENKSIKIPDHRQPVKNVIRLTPKKMVKIIPGIKKELKAISPKAISNSFMGISYLEENPWEKISSVVEYSKKDHEDWKMLKNQQTRIEKKVSRPKYPQRSFSWETAEGRIIALFIFLALAIPFLAGSFYFFLNRFEKSQSAPKTVYIESGK